jgi:hypothetical protein
MRTIEKSRRIENFRRRENALVGINTVLPEM